MTWNGTNAIFTGSTGSEYNAVGGASVVFNVTTVPEPSSIALIGTILGGLLVSLRKRRHA